MRWEPDVSRGDWLHARLDPPDTRPWTIHLMVPRGFPRYDRIFHPARWATDPWDAPPVPWHEIAAARGVAAHPLMSWHDLVAIPDGPDPLPRPGEFADPECGRLEDGRLTAIAAHLARFTSTPDRGVAGVWDGWGDLFASSYGRSWRVTGGPDPDPVPGLPDEVRDGPRLQLPWRDHVLFDAGASEFTAGWPDRAPWAHGSHPWSPSVLWPDDRAWVLVCDVDWTSTIVGGPVELMAPLLSDPAVDGCLLPEGAPAVALG